jgi:hypothetical protein
VQFIEYLHDDPYVAVSRRLPCSDDAQGSLVMLATSQQLLCLEPIALEQQVGRPAAGALRPQCRVPPRLPVAAALAAHCAAAAPCCALAGSFVTRPACPAPPRAALQVRELLKRKRFQQALELLELCTQEAAAAARAAEEGPGAAASAAATAAWVGEGLAQAGLLLLLDIQFDEAVQVRTCACCLLGCLAAWLARRGTCTAAWRGCQVRVAAVLGRICRCMAALSWCRG